MAIYQIGQFRVPNSSYASPFTLDRIVKCFYNDSSDDIDVYVYESDGTLVSQETSGPTFTSTSTGGREFQILQSGYQFCDTTTLRKFFIDLIRPGGGSMLIFPYTREETTLNHYSCSLITCDILFDSGVTSVTEDSGAGDGSITVLANTSNGTPRYTLDPNEGYADAEESEDGSYTFDNLVAGTYVIYGLDQYNCKAQITVIVPEAEANYGVKYRLEYNDIRSLGATKLEIEEKDYSGAVTEICGADDPVVMSWKGSWIFDEFFPLEINLRLLSQTDFQFIDLFTADERQYRVKYYRNNVLRNIGYNVTMLYSEPFYTTKNYPVSITATDQLGTLKDLDFVDDFGNWITEPLSFLDAICIILRKTNLNLNLRESINIFAEGMGISYLSFSNPTFDTSLFPWTNFALGSGTVNQWAMVSGSPKTSGTITSGSYSQTYALIQKPDTGDWPSGNYSISVTCQQTGFPAGLECRVYSYTSGFSETLVGLLGIVSDGAGQTTLQATVNLATANRFLGIKLVTGTPISSGSYDVIIYSINMLSSPVDEQGSAIQQAYFDPSVYYTDSPYKCDYVLRNILRIWGARLYQDLGLWICELVEQKPGTAEYREFNLTGELQSTGSSQPISYINATDSKWLERSQALSINPFYNKIKFNIINNIENNLLTQGTFEDSDIVNGQFKGWAFDISNAGGVQYGQQRRPDEDVRIETKQIRGGRFEPVKREVEKTTDDSCLFVDFSNTDSGAEIIISAEQFNLSAISGKQLRFSMDVFLIPFYTGFIFPVDVSVKIGDRWFTGPSRVPQLTSGLLIDGEYMRFNIDKTLEWKTIVSDISTAFRGTNVTLEGPVIVKIRLNNTPTYDYASITALKAQVTAGNTNWGPWEYTVNVLDDTVVRIYRFKRAVSTSENTEDSPDNILPDDYNSSTNKVRWELVDSLPVPTEVDFLLNRVLIDNVKLAFVEEFESLSYEKSFNQDVKLDYETDIIPTDVAIYPADIENPDNTEDNDQRLVKNYIRFNNGTPTKRWARDYVTIIPTEPTVGALSTGTNEDTGTDWTISSAPTINTFISSKSKIYTLAVSDLSFSVTYAVELDFDLYTSSTANVKFYLLDSSLNELDSWSKIYTAASLTNRVETFEVSSDVTDPAYIGVEIISYTGSTMDTEIVINSIDMSIFQVLGESLSLINILMKMYQGQLTEPSYKLNGKLLVQNGESFYYNFYVDWISKTFIPVSMILHDKRQELDVELVEVKTGEGGAPPADVYEFTTEFTTEFDA